MQDSLPQISPDVTEQLLAVTDAPPGKPTLAAAVAGLAKLLGVKCAFAAELVPDKPSHGRTLAMWFDGELVDNFEYPLAGTPCEVAQEREMCFFGSGVQQLFPEDRWLVDVGAQSYMAVPCKTPSGERVGYLGIVHDLPLTEDLGDVAVFRVFAAIVGAVLVARHEERQRLEMERQILEGHRLESLGILAGGVAHDFNNLLVGVSGNISLALMNTAASSPIRHFLEEVEDVAQRAAELAKQMLAYSGKGRFVVAQINFSHVVEEMMSLLSVSVPKTIELRAELDSELPAVTADVTQIRQLIMNLVLNATDAIQDKTGTISLTTGTTKVDEQSLRSAKVGRSQLPGDYVFLEIRDSGCGLSADVMARMFDPFYSNTPTGRGLGLAAVHGIVKGHHGVLKVESQVGRGTSFRLMLPATGLEPTALPTTFEATNLEGLTALVVDDDETVQVTGTRMLEHLGCKVLLAEDGEKGVAAYEKHQADIDFVLLDMTMPRMGGEEAFRLIREIDPDARVILMSGYDKHATTSHFAGKGLSGFLQKPFNVDSLTRALSGHGSR